MIRFLFFCILLLFVNKIEAQDIQFDENCVLFQDAKPTLSILILKDSILYKGNLQEKQNTIILDILINYGIM
ncbi:hypothetical protein [uncultured Flavobacterium sp.]|uniref:hypothetical protein n=1 Tax=uncultured Flavobacterium sp. TaxID=165435 RepID=UPI0030CA3F79